MSEQSNSRFTDVVEKEIVPVNGIIGIMTQIVLFLFTVGSLAGGIVSLCLYEEKAASGVFLALGIILIVAFVLFLVVFCIMFAGFHVINPNEALVMTFFGHYYGTIKKAGFYFTNPFASGFNPTAERVITAAVGAQGTQGNVNVYSGTGKKISTKTMTLNNDKQKVNDALGNPVIIGAVVIWRVADPTKAVFNVDNYKKYLSTQCDSTIRNNARLYPYDTMEEDTDEKTLRGSSLEIAENMKAELQERV